MEQGWWIELLGGLRATRGEQVVVHFRTQKTAALLAYLAYHGDRRHPRDGLMEMLWPDNGLDAARASLSVALSALRRQLSLAPAPPEGQEGAATDRPAGSGERVEILLADHSTVQLNPAAVTTDVALFEVALAGAAPVTAADEQARWLTRAVELYRGELLPGYFESWILPERQWLAERYFQALGALLGHLERQGERHRAIQYAHQGVRIDPLREEMRQELMRLYAGIGQPAAALQQYQELERALREQLGTTPAAATRALRREIEGRGGAGRSRSDGADSGPVSGGAARPAPADEKPLAIRAPGGKPAAAGRPGHVGGVVPLDSAYYVVRPTDGQFRAAIERRDSIVLVKGARQMGKTSLLARGLQQAREAGARVVLTDFQMLDAGDLESVERLFPMLAGWIADQLGLDVIPSQVWKGHLGSSVNLERFLRREVLEKIDGPLVWGLDEVDRLFPCDFGSQVFGLFRSWHNRRGLEPDGPWSRLSLAIAYAMEAHLFITDTNQSPFNVGTRLALDDFTLEQMADLNARYGSPLTSRGEVEQFHALVSGHPYLSSRGLQELAERGVGIDALAARADEDEGLFGDHLRRILVLLTRDRELGDGVCAVLRGGDCPSGAGFYRLRSAGVLAGESPRNARVRCPLYASFLARHLL